MREVGKGLGWILLGILPALLSLGGGLALPVLGGFSGELLELLGLICGLVGISYLYLQDAARARGETHQRDRENRE